MQIYLNKRTQNLKKNTKKMQNMLYNIKNRKNDPEHKQVGRFTNLMRTLAAENQRLHDCIIRLFCD